MREIGLRDLRAKIGNELRDLPFEIIKRNRPVAVVVDADWYYGAVETIKEFTDEGVDAPRTESD